VLHAAMSLAAVQGRPHVGSSSAALAARAAGAARAPPDPLLWASVVSPLASLPHAVPQLLQQLLGWPMPTAEEEPEDDWLLCYADFSPTTYLLACASLPGVSRHHVIPTRMPTRVECGWSLVALCVRGWREQRLGFFGLITSLHMRAGM